MNGYKTISITTKTYNKLNETSKKLSLPIRSLVGILVTDDAISEVCKKFGHTEAPPKKTSSSLDEYVYEPSADRERIPVEERVHPQEEPDDREYYKHSHRDGETYEQYLNRIYAPRPPITDEAAELAAFEKRLLGKK